MKDRSLLLLLLALVLLLVGGTAGYRFIAGWTLLESFYMTVITVTTIGFGEILPLDETGRAFTLVLIVGGVALVAALISRVGQLVVEAGINRSHGRRRMMRRVDRMRDHFIICGYGRIGSTIAVELFENDVDFVVVEGDEDRIAHAQGRGYAVVLGDASRDATLLSAGIERARGCVLCVRDDPTNVNVALAARELNPNLQIVARGSDPSLEYRLNRAGADTVVYPMKLGGEQIARLLADKHDVPDDIEAGSMRVLGYELRVFTNVEEERTVRDMLYEREAVRPVAIRREDGSLEHNPKPDLLVASGESLLLLVNEEQRDEIRDRRNRIAKENSGIASGDSADPADGLVQWTDDLSVNVAQIDDEHRMLFKYVRDFQTAVLDGSGNRQLNRVFELLLQYTETHFSHEEILMRESDYPGLEDHATLHDKLTRQVMQLRRDRRIILPDNVFDFLSDWLITHINEHDRAFATYLKDRASEA